ncbi:MAG TPA: hypothetical protein PKH36_01715 [Flavobacteriales bacterium]|nr:hypothetical protein [Flavobacteriales bacterium]HNK67414.1 hypothetical protein [Flavobacteriales bacterium]
MTITTAYSLWLAPLCVALGVSGAWLLYRRSTENQNWPRWMPWLLGGARAFVIALLAFFLLEPMVRILVREVRKPVIVLAHDGSSSLLATGDTVALRTGYHDALNGLMARLGPDYDVRPFTYGTEAKEGIDISQHDGRTDIDRLFRAVYDRFAGPDLGAVIIDGDGIYNTGRDPRLSAERLGVPVYTIALGDTTVRPDLVLRDVEHNRITYLGNEFPVSARVEARHFGGRATRVSILRDGKELVGKDLAVSADPMVVDIPFLIKADAPGTMRLTVRVAVRDGESNVANNERTIHIDVLDDRQRILLLALAPHPDVAALRQSLEGLEGYRTEVAYAESFQGAPEAYDLIVLHQLPSSKATIQPVLHRIVEKRIPTLTIIGQNTDLGQLNALETGLSITNGQRIMNDAQAAVNTDFALFTLDPEEVRAYERFPPLQVPIGTYTAGRSAETLLFQKVGVVRTGYPLMVIDVRGERPAATICGEGLWRWRLADQQMYGGTERSDQLVRKTAALLSLKEDRNRFRVRHAPEFATSDKVTMRAELYNASYEPVNTPEASITFADEAGKEYRYTFSRNGTGYTLEAGSLPPGRYTWKAATILDKETLTATGSFRVNELMAERLSTVADHALWENISARTGGIMVHATDLDRIADTIATARAIVPRSYSHAGFSDLIGLRWIFFAVLALLTLEWAMRRRSGLY